MIYISNIFKFALISMHLSCKYACYIVISMQMICRCHFYENITHNLSYNLVNFAIDFFKYFTVIRSYIVLQNKILQIFFNYMHIMFLITAKAELERRYKRSCVQCYNSISRYKQMQVLYVQVEI